MMFSDIKPRNPSTDIGEIILPIRFARLHLRQTKKNQIIERWRDVNEP